MFRLSECIELKNKKTKHPATPAHVAITPSNYSPYWIRHVHKRNCFLLAAVSLAWRCLPLSLCCRTNYNKQSTRRVYECRVFDTSAYEFTKRYPLNKHERHRVLDPQSSRLF